MIFLGDRECLYPSERPVECIDQIIYSCMINVLNKKYGCPRRKILSILAKVLTIFEMICDTLLGLISPYCQKVMLNEQRQN